MKFRFVQKNNIRHKNLNNYVRFYFNTLYRASFIILCKDQQTHTLLTARHTQNQNIRGQQDESINIQVVFTIKPTICTNFTNLFCHETLHVSDISSVHHQQFIQCKLSNGVCHTDNTLISN